jgi:hypothetical protein
VFQRLDEETAWEAEGLLIGCWLALRDDVWEAKYSPQVKKYHLTKERLKEELGEFLKDMKMG